MPGWVWPNGSSTRPRLAGQGTPAEAEADFGPRTIGKKFHDGTDFVGLGTVRAIGGGRVTRIERWDGRPPGTTRTQHGNRVFVDHSGGVESSYSHLDRVDVTLGDDVEAADGLGPQGDTGFVTGSHLHLEVRVNGVLVDPVPFLSARVGANPAGGGGTPFEEDDMSAQAESDIAEVVAFVREIRKAGGMNGGPGEWDKPLLVRGAAASVDIHDRLLIDADGNGTKDFDFFDEARKILLDIQRGVVIAPEQVKAVADEVARQLGKPTVDLDYARIEAAARDGAKLGAREGIDGATIRAAGS